ncbi:hypothetical protein ACFV10_18260 [Streptomyces cyaneofuscatus]|uniref:hypothetical protein n=1 Tax=Streptomyces cyaneofuscatus TaxID=66883 RepID=UPI0036844D56
MTTATHSHPCAHSTEAGTFPTDAEFPAVWRELLAESAAWTEVDIATYLRTWCGRSPAEVAARFAGVNHIGVYLGDYASDEEVFRWHSYLEGLRRDGELTGVEMGPSYISPRQYGTPGWWLSVSLPDGRVIETFTCRHFGAWTSRPVAERRRLMSHVALEVSTAEDVREVLAGLEGGIAHVEAIAYTEADEVGHTYGHLRNNVTRSVLEIVHDAGTKDGPADNGNAAGADGEGVTPRGEV